MKINKIKINAFGKLKNKEIDFKDNLNIVYGKNESGKSTLLKFMLNCFYGTSKNKRGKDVSDFDRYKPWKAEEFSGKIKYQLDSGKVFEIYREFSKKNPKVFDENMQDISNEYNIDKTKGNEFFYEQTKIDENLFYLTTAIEQKEVQLDVSEQNVLIQKIANILGTGEDNVSYKKAIEKISKRQLNEIGTDKSKERPINIVSQEIRELIQEIKELETYSVNKSLIEEKESNIKNKIIELEKEIKLIKRVKELYISEIDVKNEIKIKEELNNKNKSELIDIEEKIRKNQNEVDKEQKVLQKQLNKYNKINISSLVILMVSLLITIKYLFVGIGIISILFILFIFVNFKRMNINNKIKNTININSSELKQKRNIMIENIENAEKEIAKIKEEYIKSNYLKREEIRNEYKDTLSYNKVNDIIETLSLEYKEEIVQEELNKLKINEHTMQLEKNNFEKKAEKKVKLEEDLYLKQKEYEELLKKSKSMDYAKEILGISYNKMKNNVAPKFTEKLSKNISEITDNKYNNIMINSESGLVIENDSGDYIPVDRLSVGTIDQIYFALRLAVMDELTEEKLPIILDEVFAYYDDERIKNILKFLNRQANRQIIIFTCTNREKEILEKLKIESNYIEI